MNKLLKVTCCAALLLALASVAMATTVSDQLAWANGKFPSGNVNICWPAFINLSGASVPQGCTPVSIRNGMVNVVLQPFTGYTAQYVLQPGSITYTENWSVPNSPTPLTVAQVRQNMMPTSGMIIALSSGQCFQWATGAWLPVTCLNVLSSINALSIQGIPVAGGTPTDGQLMKYNGATQQWDRITLIDQETPTGTIDGTNAVFTLANTPAPTNGLILFRNGIVQKAGGFDYTLSGNTLTFTNGGTPQPGDTLLAWYRY